MKHDPVEIIRARLSAAPGLIADRSPDSTVAALGLERMRLFFEEVGNPQWRPRTLHIAGSKGKGTIAYVTDAVLRASGLKVGRFTSPHIEHWNERIAIDGRSIDDELFGMLLESTEQTMVALERANPQAGSFNAFELIAGAAFLAFADADVDCAVIETGLGGRFDSTNHLRPEVTVVGRIEREHTDVLGETLTEIAWNKAGIFRNGVPAVIVHQTDEVDLELGRIAAEVGATLFREGTEWTVGNVDKDLEWQFGGHRLTAAPVYLPGGANRTNIGAALTAIALMEPAALRLASPAIAHTAIPGRFEIGQHNGVPIVLDVAHTPESLSNVMDTAADRFGEGAFDVAFSVLSDKPLDLALDIVGRAARHLVLPHVGHPRTVPDEAIFARAEAMGLTAIRAASVSEIIEGVTAPLVVTGSFAIVTEARRHLLAQ